MRSASQASISRIMSNRTDTGFLAAADVTGYTAFLTDSELDHAHEVIRGVLRELSRALTYPLEIVKYEGDAILCCAPDGALRDAPLLLDVLEQAYVRFADHLFNMRTCTKCSCRACANVRSLDLKLFLHHGRFISEDLGRGRDLSGPDVILLHRLMKNRVQEATGVRAYLLATASALEKLGRPAGFRAHEERVENFGEVACGVADLSEALGARREAREVRVDPGDAHVEREATVSGPPAAVWDYFFDPEKRLLWDVTLKRVDLRRDSRGREGPGAAMHCAHDSFTVIGTTLDWKPFRYFTQRYEFDGRGVFPSPLLVTIETEALPDGRTRLRQLLQVTSRNPLHHVMIKLLRRSFERQCAEGFERLDAVMSGREAGGGADQGTVSS